MTTQLGFRPTDEGFRDVLARRSRRRRRRHVFTGVLSGGVAALVAAVVVTTGSAGDDSLVVPPAVSHHETPAPDGAAPQPRPHETIEQSAVTARSNAAEGPITSDPTTGRSRHSAPGSGPDQPAVVPGPTHRAPSSHRADGDEISSHTVRTRTPNYTVSYDAQYPCTDTSGRAAPGWCAVVSGTRIAKRGQPVTLTVSLCRTGGLDGVARFSGTLEADFVLRRTPGDDALWHYAAQHPDRARPHDVAVHGGSCLTWQTRWSVRGNTGAPIPPGNYDLEARIMATNVTTNGEPLTKSTGFVVQ